MATATFSAATEITTNVLVKDWVSKFLARLDAFVDLTKVTNQLNRAAVTDRGGTAQIDLVDKTFTGGTNTLNGITITGATWSTPLDPISDLGRQISIGSTSTYITAINTTTNVVTIFSGISVANSGTASGIIGVIMPVNTVTTGTSWYGYSIYRFNDSLQSTHPIFIKFTFGHFAYSGGNNGIPVIAIQSGTALDGLGNLVGAANNPLTSIFGSSTLAGGEGSTPHIWYLSCSAGRLSMAKDIDSVTTSPRSIATFTRAVNSAGVMTDEFFQFFVHNVVNGTPNTNQFILHKDSGTVYPKSAGWLQAVLGICGNAFTSLVYDGNTAVMPFQPLLGSIRPFCFDLMIGKSSDFPSGSTVVIDGKTYIAVSISTTGAQTIAGMSNQNYLMRYE